MGRLRFNPRRFEIKHMLSDQPNVMLCPIKTKCYVMPYKTMYMFLGCDTPWLAIAFCRKISSCRCTTTECERVHVPTLYDRHVRKFLYPYSIFVLYHVPRSGRTERSANKCPIKRSSCYLLRVNTRADQIITVCISSPFLKCT